MIQSFAQISIYWFLRNKPQLLNIDKIVEEFKAQTQSLIKDIDRLICNDVKDNFNKTYDYYCVNSIQPSLAKQLAGLGILYSAMDIIVVATKREVPATKVSSIYFAVGDRFHFDWLRHEADQLDASTYWQRMLIKTIKDDIYDHQRRLTSLIIKSASNDLSKGINEWVKNNTKKIAIFDKFINSVKTIADLDSSKLVVATKQIESLTNK